MQANHVPDSSIAPYEFCSQFMEIQKNIKTLGPTESEKQCLHFFPSTRWPNGNCFSEIWQYLNLLTLLSKHNFIFDVKESNVIT